MIVMWSRCKYIHIASSSRATLLIELKSAAHLAHFSGLSKDSFRCDEVQLIFIHGSALAVGPSHGLPIRSGLGIVDTVLVPSEIAHILSRCVREKCYFHICPC